MGKNVSSIEIIEYLGKGFEVFKVSGSYSN